ncbi:MAG: hypothetical protein D3904_15970 [Candidatus Electrothrix sp. EH2]|nr:hypothetical protein [Candidatus Electrothrix sp. EH2]
MNIMRLGDHLTRFSNAIYSVESHCLDFASAAQLLQYAGGIEGIKYSAASEAGMYCSGVAEFERQQEVAVTPFLKAQAVFTVTWMALESMIDEINPPGASQIGKIGRLCLYLKDGNDAVVIPAGYNEFVVEWINLEKGLDTGYRPRTSLPDHVIPIGEGVYRVYSLRNHLFHGDFSGFYPTDERWNVYTKTLELGTRLVAITIQMALMIYFKDSGYMETSWAYYLFPEEDEISITKGFSKLHLSEH